MHILDERAHPLSKSLYPLILESDAFIGEMDMSTPGIVMEEKMYDTRNYLGKDAYEKLRKQLLKSFRTDLTMYNHMHPLLIMSAISNSVLRARHQISLDEHLWNYAKENEK